MTCAPEGSTAAAVVGTGASAIQFVPEVAPRAAQGGWRHVGEAEVAVDAARFPVARIAGVEDDDATQVAAEPDGGAQAGRPAADDGDVVGRVVGAVGGGVLA